MNKKTTSRDELLYTIKQIINNKGVNEFTVKEVVDYMKAMEVHIKKVQLEHT